MSRVLAVAESWCYFLELEGGCRASEGRCVVTKRVTLGRNMIHNDKVTATGLQKTKLSSLFGTFHYLETTNFLSFFPSCRPGAVLHFVGSCSSSSRALITDLRFTSV